MSQRKRLISNEFVIVFGLALLVFSGCVGRVKGSIQSLAPNFAIEPATTTISVGKKIQFTVKDGIGTSVFGVASGAGAVDAISGEFTAPLVEGQVVLRALDTSGRTAFAMIEVVSEPVLSPQDAIVTEGGSLNFTVSGGRSPYNFAVVNGGTIDAEKGIFTAAIGVTSATISVMDALGSSAQATVEIKSGIKFAQNIYTVNANSEIEILVSGGVGEIDYKVVGQGTYSSLNNKFTAGALSGSAILQAKDSVGNSASTVINVQNGSTVDDLIVMPEFTSLTPGAKTTISVQGGVEPIDLILESGAGTLDVNLRTFTASANTLGDAVIRAVDSRGKSGTSTITTLPQLSVNLNSELSDNSLYIEPGKTLEVTPLGGVGPYTVSSYQGDVVLQNGKYVYTAPAKPGMDAITIRDTLGNSQVYYVFVEPTMTLVPAQILVKKTEQFQYLVTGGKAPFQFTIQEGDSTITEDGFFTAGKLAQTIVKVVDAKGNTASSLVQVVQDMSIEPMFTIANQNQIIRSNVLGGVGPYVATVTQGIGKLCEALDTCTSVTLTSESGVFDFRAAAISENAAVTFVDANGTTLRTFIETKKEFSISLNSQEMVIGGTVKLNVEGGTPPYTVSLNPPGVLSSSMLNSTSWSLKGLTRGTATVQVVDSSGASLSDSIEVFYRDSVAQLSGLPGSVSSVTNLNITVSGTDLKSYKYAIGTGSGFSCATATYGAENLAGVKIATDISNSTNFPEGVLRLCVLAKNKDDKWQSESLATTYSWTKTQAPLAAQLSGLPSSITNQASYNVGVTGRDGVTEYKYQIVSGAATNCAAENYSAAIAVATPISVTNSSDGQKSLCVLISDGADWQVNPTTATWVYDGTAPSAPTGVVDGDGLTLLTESPTISFTAGTDGSGSGVLKTEARLMNNELSQEIVPWIEFTSGSKFTNLNLVDGTVYRVQLRTVDVAQNLSSIVTSDGWVADSRGPLIAQLDGVPTGTINTNSINVTVTGRTGTISYKYQIVSGDATACTVGGYSAEIAIANPISTTVSGDGNKTLCVLIGDGTSWQAFPTSRSWTFDGTAPTAPTLVLDGVGSTSLVESPTISFTVGTDALSGVARTELRLMTGDLSTEILPWATFTSGSKLTNLSLTDLTTYKVQLRTIDNAGNISSTVTSDGWIVDNSNPTAPTTVTDGSFSNSLIATPNITFSGATDQGSGIQKYQARVILASDSSPLTSWADITSGSSIAGTFVDAETYKVEVRTIDNGGLISGVATSDGWTIDTEVPVAPAGFTLGSVPFSLSSTPTLSWSTAGSDTGASGLAGYQAAVYQVGNATPIKTWATFTSGSSIASGIALTGGIQYYFAVRSIDNAGNVSLAENSSNWTANALDPCLAINPTVGTVCGDGTIYVGKSATTRYLAAPGGCGEIPAGQIAGGSGATSYSTTDFTVTCSGSDQVIKSWNNGAMTWYDVPSVTNYTATAGVGNGLINTDANSGFTNSTNIAAVTSSANGGYNAAAMYCNKLVTVGKNDWFLPNRYELNQMYSNQASFPGLVGSLYWSSTEYSNQKAWGQHFVTGSQDFADKNTTYFVRCFRNIDITPDTMTFTQVNTAPLSSTQESNTVVITGLEGETTLTITGTGGSPQMAISSDGGTTWGSWISSGNVINGQRIKLKVTTGTTMTQLFTTTITPTVGTAATWKVYTTNTDPCQVAGTVSSGTTCTNGTKYAFTQGTYRYQTTPSGCSSGTSPTCSGATDTFKTIWDAGSGNLYTDIPGLSNIVMSGDWCMSQSDGGNGSNNTSTIYSYNASYAAAAYCWNMNYAGKTDWFLPDVDELGLLYSNKTAIGGFASNWYWSSSENQGNTTFGTWAKNFSGGCHDGMVRNSQYFVRCVRRDVAP